VGKLWRHELATGTNTALTEAIDLTISGVEFSADGATLWFTAEDKGVVPIFKMKADGTGLTPVYKEGTSTELRCKGRPHRIPQRQHQPAERAFHPGPEERCRAPAHAFQPCAGGSTGPGQSGELLVRWCGGRQGAGLVILPPGFDAAKTYPMVQLMHGGPHTMVRDSWSYRWNAHAVRRTRLRGRLGEPPRLHRFRPKFAQSILNEWGVKPLDDILRSTDHLLARFPNIDPKRIAAAGASYGGYMAAWAEGHTDRFACIVRPRGRERLHHPIRCGRDALQLHEGAGRHAVGQPRGHAEEQPDDLREELQDADADHCTASWITACPMATACRSTPSSKPWAFPRAW
jgi:hypothetical protein